MPSPGAATIPLGALASRSRRRGGRRAVARASSPAPSTPSASPVAGKRVLLIVDDAQLLDDASAAVVHQAVAARVVTSWPPSRRRTRAGERDRAVEGRPRRPDRGRSAHPGGGEELVSDGAGRPRRRCLAAPPVVGDRGQRLVPQGAGARRGRQRRPRRRGRVVAAAGLPGVLGAAARDRAGPHRRHDGRGARARSSSSPSASPSASPRSSSSPTAAAVEALERRGLLSVGADGARRPVRLAHPLHGELLARPHARHRPPPGHPAPGRRGRGARRPSPR